MDNRRQFLRGLAGAAAACGLPAQMRPLVIDAHCHAGVGEEMTAPWTTRADIGVTLRHMEEAGIDRTIIFPINNPTYEKAERGDRGNVRPLSGQADRVRQARSAE